MTCATGYIHDEILVKITIFFIFFAQLQYTFTPAQPETCSTNCYTRIIAEFFSYAYYTRIKLGWWEYMRTKMISPCAVSLHDG